MFYINMLGSLLGLSVLVSNVDQENKRKIIIFFFFTLLLLISTLRSVNVGTDLDTYFRRYYIIGETAFGNLNELNKLWGFEYGYMIFNKIMFSISKNYYFFTFVTSGIIFLSFFKFIIRYSKDVTISFILFILLYFFGTSLNLIRLFLALSINLFSIKYLINRDFIKFLFIVLLAFTFHTSALAFIILYPLYEIEFTRESILALTSGLFIISVFSNKIVELLLGFYVYGSRYGSEIGSGDGHGIFLFQMLILLFAFIQKKHKNKNNHVWLIMLIASLIFNILAFNLTIAARVMWYFKPTLLILIPEIVNRNKNKNKIVQIILSIILFVYPVYSAVQRAKSDNEGIFPYELHVFYKEK